MLKIFKHLKPKEWLMAGVSLIFIIAQVWLDLKLPDFMSEVTKLTQTPNSAISDIWINGCFMLLCALGSLAAAIIVGYFAAKIAASFSQRLRSLLFNKVESFSMEEINRFSTSSLITRSTNDITQIQMLVVMGLQLVIKAPITAAWAMTKIAGKGFEWSVVTGVGVMIVLTMVTFLMISVMPKFKKMQTLTDNITRVTRENLTGLRVVRAYNAEDYQENKFETANKELTNTQLSTNRAMAVMMPVMNVIMSGLSLAIYWVGAYLIDAAGAMDKLTIFSNMVVFSSYAVHVIMSFMMLVMIFIMLPRASVSAKRINEVLDTQSKILDGDKIEGKPGFAGEVEFKSVSFKYPDAAEPMLENISFTAKQGETVAFIGSTGSGKTTLINLIPRFFDATDGEVLVDGVNVKDYKLESLLNKIGYVPQKAVLFKGTVESNVAYGDNGRNTSGSNAEYVNDGRNTSESNAKYGNDGRSSSESNADFGYDGRSSSESNADFGYDGRSSSGSNADYGNDGCSSSESNAGYGNDGRFHSGGNGNYSIDDVKKAVRIAQGADFVEKMGGGYASLIAQGGANISGGQKQRLAIARAVCRKPEIYIFDDSFSALDYKTDRVLRSVLKKETAGVTSLIVAQRIGTIIDADQIIVLDEGKIVGKGTHKELLRNCAVYKEIALSQLSEEELVS